MKITNDKYKFFNLKKITPGLRHTAQRPTLTTKVAIQKLPISPQFVQKVNRIFQKKSLYKKLFLIKRNTRKTAAIRLRNVGYTIRQFPHF